MLEVGDNPGHQRHARRQMPVHGQALWPVMPKTGSCKQWHSGKQHDFLPDLQSRPLNQLPVLINCRHCCECQNNLCSAYCTLIMLWSWRPWCTCSGLSLWHCRQWYWYWFPINVVKLNWRMSLFMSQYITEHSLSYLSLQFKGKCKREITRYHTHSRTFPLHMPDRI